jgi:hypothetical protein
MEHRELPHTVPADPRPGGAGDDTEGRFRLRMFEQPRGRRHLDLGRAGLLTFAIVACSAGFFYGAFRARKVAIEWLYRQSQYQFPFRDIRLVPEPPRWYRGGRREFLERVRQGAGEAHYFSILDVVPERLALAFKKYAWVEDVRKVNYSPGKIVVTLEYRQPVAWVDLPGGKQPIVDDQAIILAANDVDLDQLGQVMKVWGEGLAPPSDPRAGVIWKLKSASSDVDEPDLRIRAAARLAGFLRTEARMRDAARAPALRILEIIVTDLASRGLFMMNAEGAEIWWGRAPGDEAPGMLTAEQKWTMLVEWQQSTRSRFLKEGDYWAFSRKGVYHVCPPAHPRHRPSEVSEADRDPPTTGRKPRGSG